MKDADPDDPPTPGSEPRPSPQATSKKRTDAARHALVAMYCRVRRWEVINDLAELLIRIAHRISTRAERCMIQELVREVRKVRGKITLLFKMAEAAFEHPDEAVRDVLFPVVDERTLADLVAEYRSTGPGYLRKIHPGAQ